MGTGEFPKLKRAGRNVNHTSHLGSSLKEEYSYTSTPPLDFHGDSRVNVSFYLIILRDFGIFDLIMLVV
jgi:hypothetical protein